MSEINVLTSSWRFADYWGALRVRLGIGRNRYRVNPGLYKIGTPGEETPVYVTANYKLSLDHLRRALTGRDSWILVLDTKGINVWCAAGKGSFGTKELVHRIQNVSLSDHVSHRQLILPQLGAPGMVPSQVRKESGFSICYGPVEAVDLPAFMDQGQKATPEMRRKRFPLSERLAVSLTHLSQGIFPTLGIALFFCIIDVLFFRTPILTTLFDNLLISAASLIFGTVLAGALLFVLPGKAFSLKGFILGLFMYLFLFLPSPTTAGLFIYPLSKILILHCWIVFSVLNLTGSSTYTSLSGVRKEMSISVPLLIAGTAAGLAGIIIGGILG